MPKSHQLAGVDDVFNAVLVKGDMLGDVVFYGKGAGKLPTASAVVADVVDALKNGVKVHDSLFWQPAEPVEGMLTDPAPAAYYVRVEGIAPAVAEAIYGKGHVVEEHFDGCSYFVDSADGKALAEAARKVEAMGGSVTIPGEGNAEAHSSGSLSAMIGCNCLVELPAGSGPVTPGEEVEVLSFVQ